MGRNIQDFLKSFEKEAIPQLSVNCVIFGYHARQLYVAVNHISFQGNELLVLPGGYVKQREDLRQAATRIVKDSTGWENILLKQFDVFGKVSRSFREDIAGGTGIDLPALEWFSKRFISICYLALVDYENSKLNPSLFFDGADWLPIDEAASLSMDHAEILSSAVETMAKELLYTPIAANLLPEQFTLPDLLALVESILGKQLDRPNFRRKILKTGVLEKVGHQKSGKGRPANLYQFKYGRNTSFINVEKIGL